MSLETFLAISPSEFAEAYESWREVEKLKRQDEWNRARWTVFKTLCPPDKKRITILDIETFSWDPKDPLHPEVPISNRDLFEQAKKKYGKRLQTRDRNSSKC